MKKTLALGIAIIFVFAGQNFADVKKRTKSQVAFSGFGAYKIEEMEKITAGIKRTDSKSEFKGKGIAGKLVGKFMNQGETGEIINLLEMMLYNIDHEDKKYSVRAIEKMSPPTTTTDEKGDPSETKQDKPQKSEQNNIRIIRSEFRVDRTGEEQNHNNFPCEKFVLLALTEWEEVQSGQRGIDSLSTIIWMTPITEDLRMVSDEESKFTKAHLEAIGMDVEQINKDILGTIWLSLLGKMKNEEKDSKSVDPKLIEEMKKLEGYPIIIDGKYFAIRPGLEDEQDEEEPEVPDVKKSVGRFARGLVKKSEDKPKGPNPAFTYYTELIEYALTNFSESDLQVDPKYKKK